MDIHFVVCSAQGPRLLAPLARACARRGLAFAAFFTHEAVTALHDEGLLATLAAATRATVCKESWLHFVGSELPPPLQFGSQTQNSVLCKQSGRIVSL
ncbi:MAG: hypothetical protein AB1761_08065 [Pseudomonadota bacterium]